MLHKLLFTLLTAMLLTVAGLTTGIADPGNGDGDGVCIGTGGGDGDGDRDRDRDRSCKDDEAESSSAGSGLTSDEINMLLFMREEEKLARDSYLTLGDQWSLVIFENIAVSEQKHMDAVKMLIDKYNLTDPALKAIGDFTDQDLQDFYDYLMGIGIASVMDGLWVGAVIEETDIDDIQQAINGTSQTHIISTYESLLCGSRNHLRAFVRQIESNGGTYDPIILVDDHEYWETSIYTNFWDLAYSEMEHDCGGNKKGHIGG